jgi:hypothetical protein
MAWPAGKRRNNIDASRIVRALVAEYGARPLARKVGVSDRTIRRWASGEDHVTRETIDRVIDAILPVNVGSLPIYSAEMAIDGNTRVAGVGEFSIRAARGRATEEDFSCDTCHGCCSCFCNEDSDDETEIDRSVGACFN